MKKMFIVLCICLSLLVSSCQTAPKEFKIGVMLTLSGPYASVGVAEMYAIEYAIDEINEEGGILGHTIELVIQDDEANPIIAQQIIEEFYEQDIHIVIGPSLSITVLDVVQYANSRDMVLLSPSVGTEMLSGLDDAFIRNVMSTLNEGKQIAESMLQDNPEHMLMVYSTDNLAVTDYHRIGFLDVMEEQMIAEARYQTAPFSTNNQEDIDFIENELLKNDCEAIFIAGSNVDTAPIVNFIKANELQTKIYLSSWAMTGLIERIESVDTEGIYGFAQFNQDSNLTKYQTFKTAYEARYGVEVSMVSVNAYDIVYLLKEAVKYGESFDWLQIKSSIIELNVFQGITGQYEINAYGDAMKTVHRFVISEQKWVMEDE